MYSMQRVVEQLRPPPVGLDVSFGPGLNDCETNRAHGGR